MVGFSILLAVFLARSGAADYLFTAMEERRFVGSFFAGMFFTSILTAAPATVILGKLAAANPLGEVVLAGALGALVGDFVILRFIRGALAEDILAIVRASRHRRLTALLRLGLFRWFVPLVGALVIASPLPDELGLALLGLSKVRTRTFIPLSYVLNAFGILVIGLVARGIA